MEPVNFEFATAGRIVFGPGKLADLTAFLPAPGSTVLLVTGQGGADAEPVENLLSKAGVAAIRFFVAGEPSIPMVEQAVSAARADGCAAVIGFGGGSVIDAAKAAAALLTNPGEVLDYLEVVGKGLPLPNPALPCAAVPTTAGTGSEVTRNAVLSVPGRRMKVSLRGAALLPVLAVVDPRLTLSLPLAVTAATGMDALTQLVEPYVSRRANAMTDLFCREGIRRVARSFFRAYQDGANLEARTDMSYASLLGGLALANAGLGAVHGFAAPIGGMFSAPHGAVCACLLPAVTAANVLALRSRAPDHPALDRYLEISRWLTGSEQATIDDGIGWLGELVEALAIPPLSAYGIRAGDLREIAEKSVSASSMKTNPVTLLPEELLLILDQAL